MLEVEPEIVSKIQARARELGVSVDEYLRELVDKKETESKTKAELSSQERVRLLRESGHRVPIPTRRFSEYAISRNNIYSDCD
jgi:hypothetical protein